MNRRLLLTGAALAPAAAAATDPEDKQIINDHQKTIKVLLGIVDNLTDRVIALEKRAGLKSALN